MAGFAEEMHNSLAASLAIMTLRPGVPVTLPAVDGTYPEPPQAAWIQETGVEASMVAPDPVVDVVADVPEFTPEMAQAFLEAPPIPAAETDSPDTMAPRDAEVSMPVDPVPEVPAPSAADPVFASESPLSADASDANQPDHQEVAEDAPAIDPLAGFDPSKYLGLGAGVPQTTLSPPPPPAPEEHPEEPQPEAVPTASITSIYGDIQPGSGSVGAKNSREAMQMLRELAVLRAP